MNSPVSPPPARQGLWRAISRASARAFIRFGRTSWWRILLGLTIIGLALIAFIAIPTHQTFVATTPAGPERDAVVRVVKATAYLEAKRLGMKVGGIVDIERSRPAAKPARPQSPEAPEPPEPPKSSGKAGKGELNLSLETKAERKERELAKARAEVERLEGELEAVSEDTQDKMHWKIQIWGMTFEGDDLNDIPNYVPREALLSPGRQAQIEANTRFDVRKALYGSVALLGYTLFAILLLIVRGFAGRAARQTQRVKVVEAAARVDSSARQIAEAQLQAMQAQVEPHFLFNTLAHVKALQEVDVAQAGEMLDSLIAYLRTALPNLRGGSSTLGKEFELAQNYLKILQLRMNERLSFSLDLPESLKQQPFPPALIINLVENAVKHGLERTRAGGSVRLTAQRAGDSVIVTVADTGKGLDPTAPGGTGVGLSSIRNRLGLLYGKRAQFSLEPNSPHGVIATLTLPADMQNGEPTPAPMAANGAADATDEAVSDCKVNTALILALVGGIGGAHNWYLHRKKTAIVQGILGTIGLTSALDGDPQVWTFIAIGVWVTADAVIIATKSMKDGFGRLVLRDR